MWNKKQPSISRGNVLYVQYNNKLFRTIFYHNIISHFPFPIPRPTTISLAACLHRPDSGMVYPKL
jgi:hypothetical protein